MVWVRAERVLFVLVFVCLSGCDLLSHLLCLMLPHGIEAKHRSLALAMALADVTVCLIRLVSLLYGSDLVRWYDTQS